MRESKYWEMDLNLLDPPPSEVEYKLMSLLENRNITKAQLDRAAKNQKQLLKTGSGNTYGSMPQEMRSAIEISNAADRQQHRNSSVLQVESSLKKSVRQFKSINVRVVKHESESQHVNPSQLTINNQSSLSLQQPRLSLSSQGSVGQPKGILKNSSMNSADISQSSISSRTNSADGRKVRFQQYDNNNRLMLMVQNQYKQQNSEL